MHRQLFYVNIIYISETYPGMVNFADSFEFHVQSGRHFDSSDLIFELPPQAMRKCVMSCFKVWQFFGKTIKQIS